MFYNFADVESDAPRLYIEGEIAPNEPWWDSLVDAYGCQPGNFVTPPKFREALKKCRGKSLTVVVDSQGGDFAAGVAIYEALRAHEGETTVQIYRAYSAASLIALGADKRLISAGGSIMIHSPMVCDVEGNWQDLQMYRDFLLKLRDSAAAIYARHLPWTAEEAAAAMDTETFFSSQDAVAMGWATGLIGDDVAQATMRGRMHATMRATETMIRSALARADEDKERAEILRQLNR